MNDTPTYNATTAYTCPRCNGTDFVPDYNRGELLMSCSNPNCTWFCSHREFDRARDVVCDTTT